MQLRQVRRSARIEGVRIPLFIHNGSYHLSGVDVFADGVIDCWGAVDLSLFQEKLAIGWVEGTAYLDSYISVFGLGGGRVEEGYSGWTPDETFARVSHLVRELNPDLQNLIDMQGSAVEKDRPQYSKVYCKTRLYRMGPDQKPCWGEELLLFRKHEGEFRLAQWTLFNDGMCQVEDGPLLAFEDSCEYLRSGSYTCKPPADCWLLLDYLGKYRLVDACWHVDLEDRILEGRDLVGRLSGKRGVVSLCLAALEVYLGNPNHENREALRLAYEAVPRHNRRYCGDMDTKDIPIRMILYGQQEIESWSHRIASRQRGMSLPEISVPLVEGPDR